MISLYYEVQKLSAKHLVGGVTNSKVSFPVLLPWGG